MSESVTPWSHTLLLLFFFSFLFLFLWRDHVVCRLAYLDYVSEKMRLRFPIHIVCLFIFFVWDFPRTNGANLPMLFSGHKNFNTHKHFAQNQPTSSTLIRIHRQKSHQKLFAFRHFWNIETEREREGASWCMPCARNNDKLILPRMFSMLISTEVINARLNEHGARCAVATHLHSSSWLEIILFEFL